METDESAYIRKCQAGDQESFGFLYDTYVKKIYNFIYYRTHHKDTAEDLTSTVFIKALENIRTFNGEKAKFSTWLYQIARNTVIDHYRTFKAVGSIEDAWDVPASVNIERDVDAAASLEKVRKYLEGLPAQQRDVVLMRVWDGLSHKEIAEILGITEASSKMTFSRTMGKLNKQAAFALVYLLALMPF